MIWIFVAFILEVLAGLLLILSAIFVLREKKFVNIAAIGCILGIVGIGMLFGNLSHPMGFLLLVLLLIIYIIVLILTFTWKKA